MARTAGGTMRFSPRKWLRRAAVAMLVTCVLLLVGELVLRLFGYGSLIIYQPDEVVLWRPVPGQQGLTVVGKKPITINNDGFRYPEDLKAAGPDDLTIFTFGDSVTMGWGVDDDSHYTALLGERLASKWPQREVRAVSAGVNAYPLTLCVRRFGAVLEQGHDVDLAVLAYSFNVAFEPITALEGPEKEAFLRKVRLKGWVRRSALYNLVVEDLMRVAVYYRIRDRLMEGSWKTDDEAGADDRGEAQGMVTYRASLHEVKRIAGARSVPLVFLLLGSQDQGEQLATHQQIFVDFARQNDIPLVNMVDRFARRDHEPLFMDHTHPTALGHRLIAEELASVVEQELSP